VKLDHIKFVLSYSQFSVCKQFKILDNQFNHILSRILKKYLSYWTNIYSKPFEEKINIHTETTKSIKCTKGQQKHIHFIYVLVSYYGHQHVSAIHAAIFGVISFRPKIQL
jgi:hypothetical protein